MNDRQTLQGHDSAMERQQAARRLASDPGAVDSLRQAILSDQDRSVKMTAVESLARIGSPEAVDALLSLWRQGPPAVDAALQLHSVWGLEQVGEGARAKVRALLDDPDPQVRWLAVQAAAAIGGDGLRQALEGRLQDEAQKVREEARRRLDDLP